MRYKVYSFLFLSLLTSSLMAQSTLSGKIVDSDQNPLPYVEVFLVESGDGVVSDEQGQFQFKAVERGNYQLTAFAFGYKLFQTTVKVEADRTINFSMQPLAEELSEVVVMEQRKKLFALRSLKKVEGTAIFAGKKSEVVQMELLTANLAANAPRQIYSQVVGLNIYENADAGIQLNIGGRGLDPSRSSNFNVRQNQYDISADVLGYPESYYTPPAEALAEIQVIRGAASLQYGTQFGGLINFKFRQPSVQKIALVSRQTLGSYGLKTSFNSLSGKVGKLAYYTYFNYKEGNSWRTHSDFSSRNIHTHLDFQWTEKTKLTAEVSWFNYLAQQAGGLTDAQFYSNPNFSNRSRNWFDVDWRLYALRLEHQLKSQTQASLQIFGLDASRSAVGFRENRVSQPDDLSSPRELLFDQFQNWGAEARLLHRYEVLGKNAVALLGAKYYHTYNRQFQGAGTNGTGPDFRTANDLFPNYARQAEFTFPNKNLALFAENIFTPVPKLTLTPGIRVEYIRTASDGFYRDIVLDLAGNPLRNEAVADDRIFERRFVLLGLGLSYDFSPAVEGYANISENYRSVTFSDIRVTNPSFVVDENITDESGFTVDFGIRGRAKDYFSFDVSLFGLRYNQRLGEVLFVDTDGSVKRRRGNIGDAFIYGVESLLDWNIKAHLFPTAQKWQLNWFANTAWTRSEYIASEAVGVEGNQVEFIPEFNIKTGLRFGWKNLTASLLHTSLTEQFTDASNAPQDKNDNQRGIEGAIPAYRIMDLSLAYRWKQWKLETGINNLLDEVYFTRRATGYPGPGIIPAEPRTGYITLEYSF
ncbi:MAG: TonB-dependent receptor domain-containing protein [Flavobacteriaceae bacterium]